MKVKSLVKVYENPGGIGKILTEIEEPDDKQIMEFYALRDTITGFYVISYEGDYISLKNYILSMIPG